MAKIKWLDQHFEEVLLILLLVLISFVELAQVIVRNIPSIPALTWAEEFCRFCWIWSVFLSLPYTIRQASMLRVKVLLDLFPVKIRNSINIVVDVITALTMGFLGFHSISVIQRIIKSAELSPAMQWPMWMVYSIMLLSFFLATLRGFQQAYLHLRSFREDSMTTLEQTMAEAEKEADAGRKAEGGIV